MRSCGLVLTWLLAWQVYGQSDASLITQMPSCALNCILRFLPDTSCTATDFACLCRTPDLWTNSTTCVVSTCTVKEGLKAQNVSAQVCRLPERDRTVELVSIGPTLGAVALVSVVLRVIAKRPFATDLFGWDDSLILLALLFSVPLVASHIYLGLKGLGKDIWNVSFDNITKILLCFYVAEVFYLLATVTTKISILMFYLRIFPSRRFQMVAKMLIVLNAAFCVSFFFPLIFQCSPVSYAWTRWSGETLGTCISVNAGTWSHAAINMVLDLAVLILPLPALFKLRLGYDWRKRLRIFVMFSFGVVVTIVSALRLQTLIMFAKTRNPTWDYRAAAVWSIVETMVGIICACLPMAKVFFTKIVPQWLGLTEKSGSWSSGSGAVQAAQNHVAAQVKNTRADHFFKDDSPQKPTLISTIRPTREDRHRERLHFVPLVELDHRGRPKWSRRAAK